MKIQTKYNKNFIFVKKKRDRKNYKNRTLKKLGGKLISVHKQLRFQVS